MQRMVLTATLVQGTDPLSLTRYIQQRPRYLSSVASIDSRLRNEGKRTFGARHVRLDARSTLCGTPRRTLLLIRVKTKGYFVLET